MPAAGLRAPSWASRFHFLASGQTSLGDSIYRIDTTGLSVEKITLFLTDKPCYFT